MVALATIVASLGTRSMIAPLSRNSVPIAEERAMWKLIDEERRKTHTNVQPIVSQRTMEVEVEVIGQTLKYWW